MKLLFITILIACISYGSLFAQDSTKTTKEYSFIIVDSPASLFTMRQFNENYFSSYRLLSSSLDKHISNYYIAELIKVLGVALLFVPLTHEEGHRSILTVNNIGSISRPYYNKEGVAKVTGVTDATLLELRDNDLPTFIRLHTAGLESDYMLTTRAETLLAFNEEDFNVIKWEYWFRKLGIMQYYLVGLFKYEGGFKEEVDEMDRDIVGLDTYGAARHLFRSEMVFYRYTNYSDLEKKERQFVRRMGFRSLFNLLNPAIVGIPNLRINQNVDFQIGMGYALAPFGDFIDQNIWIKTKRHHIQAYFRQYQNYNAWFPAMGITYFNLNLSSKISGTLAAHYWSQPKDLDFFTKKSFHGGALDATLKYKIIESNLEGRFRAITLNLGCKYKTRGFLPEEGYLKEHFGLRLGTSVLLGN